MWKILIWLCLASLPASVFVFWQHVAVPAPAPAGVEAPRVQSPVRAPRAPVGGIRADVPAGAVPGEGAAPLLPPLSLSLSGHVAGLGEGVVPTHVLVRVGNGPAVPATLSGNGFSFALAHADRRATVTIETSAPRARYRSQLGSVELLKRQAGADGVLTAEENPGVRVSPLTTAIHFFLARELEGRVPASDDELERAIRALYVDDLARAANMLAKTAAGAPLPDGYADGLELLFDRETYRNHLLFHTISLGGWEEYVRDQPGIAFTPADLGRDWLLTGRMPLAGVPFAVAPVQLMRRTANGYAVHAGPGRRNVAFTSQLLANGDLELLPDGQVSYDVIRQLPWGTGASLFVDVLERHIVQRETYRRVFIGKRDSLWLTMREELYRYPQYPERQGGAITTRFETVSELARIAVPVQSADVLGRRGAPTFCLQPSPANGEPALMSDCEYTVHDFAAGGTGVIRERGLKVDDVLAPQAASGTASLAWALQADGAVRVAGPDYSVDLWRIGLTDGPADTMVYLATMTDGNGPVSSAGQTVIIDGNAPAALGPTDPVGTWRYGTFGDERMPYADSDDIASITSRFVRASDGTGERMYAYDFFAEGSTVLRYRSGWMLTNATLYETRYRANIQPGAPYTGYFPSCTLAFAQGATQCAPYDVRFFRPLARIGDRWFGIEDVYSRTSPGGYVPPFAFARASRGNLYDKQ